MKYLVYCACGHGLDRHGSRGCEGEALPCRCRRDENDALESAIAQAKRHPWSPVLTNEADRGLAEASEA